MVTVRRRPTTTIRGAVCHDGARGAKTCPDCHALVHDECVLLSAGCPTLGCRAHPRRARAVPWWYGPLSTAAGLLVVGVLAVGAVTKSKDALGHGVKESEVIRTKITDQIQ